MKRQKKLKIVKLRAKAKQSLIIDLKVLDRAYPEIDIEFIEMEGVWPYNNR
jgi:hypothetical protein